MNFGIDGLEAHAEDTWIGRRVQIGDAVVVPQGNVGRCAITTQNPETGEADLDTLKALARYRARRADDRAAALRRPRRRRRARPRPRRRPGVAALGTGARCERAAISSRRVRARSASGRACFASKIAAVSSSTTNIASSGFPAASSTSARSRLTMPVFGSGCSAGRDETDRPNVRVAPLRPCSPALGEQAAAGGTRANITVITSSAAPAGFGCDDPSGSTSASRPSWTREWATREAAVE